MCMFGEAAYMQTSKMLHASSPQDAMASLVYWRHGAFRMQAGSELMSGKGAYSEALKVNASLALLLDVAFPQDSPWEPAGNTCWHHQSRHWVSTAQHSTAQHSTAQPGTAALHATRTVKCLAQPLT